MPLLHEIQKSVVEDGTNLGHILLKLRLLASRLGSIGLEEWVRHESEGYVAGSEVPPYRIVGVSYRATFSGPFGSGIKNAPLPQHLVRKFGGAHWVEREIRESISAVEELASNSSENGRFLRIDASDLILLLQGEVYPDYSCVEVTGIVSATAFAGILQVVRARILELTIELEKSIPAAAYVEFGVPDKGVGNDSASVERITQQIVFGNVTTVSGGSGSSFYLSVGEGQNEALLQYLIEFGIPEDDASELVGIMSSEEPLGKEEALGVKAKHWLSNRVAQAAGGAWDVGVTVATKVITEGALRYYGLK